MTAVRGISRDVKYAGTPSTGNRLLRFVGRYPLHAQWQLSLLLSFADERK